MLIKLQTDLKILSKQETFYFKSIGDSNVFKQVFEKNSCPIPWKNPEIVEDNEIIFTYPIKKQLETNPIIRAKHLLSWALRMRERILSDINTPIVPDTILDKGVSKNRCNTVNISKELFKQIFDYGATYEFASSNPGKFIGSYPAEDYDKALDYAYKFLIEGERDEECLKCQKLKDKECEGCIKRGRETITENNRCAFFKPMKEYSCNTNNEEVNKDE